MLFTGNQVPDFISGSSHNRLSCWCCCSRSIAVLVAGGVTAAGIAVLVVGVIAATVSPFWLLV